MGLSDIGLDQVLRVQESCMRKWPKCPWPPFLLHYLHCQPTPITTWEVPHHHMNEEEKRGLHLQRILYNIRHHPKGMAAALHPSPGHSSRVVTKEILPADRTSSSALGCSFCMEGEMARGAIALRCSQWFYLDGQEPEGHN